MPLTTLPKQSPRTSRSQRSRTARPRTHAARQAGYASRAHGSLARYTDAEGRLREVLARPGHAGSVLVLDRDATTLGDRRLVAHLAADEPPENAALVSRHYLRDPRGRRCRPLAPEDLLTAPFPEACEQKDPEGADSPLPPQTVELCDRHGYRHRLEPLATDLSIPELRWCRQGGGAEPGRPESVRDAVACMESYEPFALSPSERSRSIARTPRSQWRCCAPSCGASTRAGSSSTGASPGGARRDAAPRG